MPLEIVVARWVAILWLVFGLSHALYPEQWAALFRPLRERETGGLLIASYNVPPGVMIVLAHNLWVWDLAVIVTIAGWLTTLKSAMYALFPRAHRVVMSAGARPERGFRSVGVVMIVLGAVTAYDAFFRR